MNLDEYTSFFFTEREPCAISNETSHFGTDKIERGIAPLFDLLASLRSLAYSYIFRALTSSAYTQSRT